MHIRTGILSAIFVLSLAATAARAQTADEIIAKHITAVGGKEKLASLESLYIEGVTVTSNGMEITTKTWKVKGKLYRQEVSFGMGEVIMIVIPGKGWSSNPRTNGEFKPMPDEMVKAMQSQLDPAGPLLDYAAKGGKAELLGKDTVGGKECYKVRLTGADGLDMTFSFDVQSFYVLRETRKGMGMMGGGGGNGGGGSGGGRRGGNPDGSVSFEFGDYQKTPDGYVLPNTISMGGSMGAKSNVEKLEVNKPVDVAALSKPGK